MKNKLFIDLTIAIGATIQQCPAETAKQEKLSTASSKGDIPTTTKKRNFSTVVKLLGAQTAHA